jgi:hypothetical protein
MHMILHIAGWAVIVSLAGSAAVFGVVLVASIPAWRKARAYARRRNREGEAMACPECGHVGLYYQDYWDMTCPKCGWPMNSLFV